MSAGILVTGTDTGIGKTLVACALARSLGDRGRVGVFKPVETGCQQGDEGLIADDAERLEAAARSGAPMDRICPFRFEEPLAPWVAAERAGRSIAVEPLRACYEELARDADAVIVESAGGLLVPIGRRYSYADLASDLGLAALVVVGSRLGALNATLLTLEILRARRIDTLGYVVNQLDPEPDLAQRTNAEALQRLTDAPFLGSVPFLKDAEDTTVLTEIGTSIAEKIFPALGMASRAQRPQPNPD